MGIDWWNWYSWFPDRGAVDDCRMGRPLAITGSGDVMLKSNVLFTSGVSWQGKIDLAWIAWHCETGRRLARELLKTNGMVPWHAYTCTGVSCWTFARALTTGGQCIYRWSSLRSNGRVSGCLIQTCVYKGHTSTSTVPFSFTPRSRIIRSGVP